MADFFIYLLIGLIAGLYSACWGVYKDSPFEDFKIKSFIRSIFYGGALGFLLGFLLDSYDINLGIFFASCVALERGATEFWKLFLRIESQKKYSIPSRIHVLGKIIYNNVLRFLTGMVIFAFLLFLFFVLRQINLNNKIWLFPIGFLFGLLGAVFGAWKDAPIEGFKHKKFLRTPLVVSFCLMLFSFWEANLGILFLASLGGERMAVEFYKSFIIKKKPAKFKTEKIVFKAWVKRRKIFIMPYIFSWLVFIILLLKEDYCCFF